MSVRVMVQRKLEAIEERQRELAGVRTRLALADICADPASDDCGALRLTS